MVWQEIPCVRQVSKPRSIRTIVDEAMDRKTHCVTDEMHYGYINRKGEYAIQPQFREAKDFSEGVALVQRESPGGGKYTFIGKDGEVAVPGEFDVGHSFSEGLAAVETGVRFELNQKVAGKVGFIDKTGKYVILPRFEVASRFSEGLASVCEKWQVCGYIDRLGRFVNAPIYFDAWDFSDGLARVAVKQDDGYFYIDKTGKNVFHKTVRLTPARSSF